MYTIESIERNTKKTEKAQMKRGGKETRVKDVNWQKNENNQTNIVINHQQHKITEKDDSMRIQVF